MRRLKAREKAKAEGLTISDALMAEIEAAVGISPARLDLSDVMPGLVPGIHDDHSLPARLDGRDKPGHDELGFSAR